MVCFHVYKCCVCVVTEGRKKSRRELFERNVAFLKLTKQFKHIKCT